MPRLFFKLTALFTFLHWLILCVSAANAIAAGVHRIDHPDSPIAQSERISRLISPVLTQPGMSISDWLRDYSDSRVLHATLELLNSLLWGAIIALIVCRLMGRRASTAHSHAKNPIA